MRSSIYADADFADLYILGLETSNIAFPIVLDGAGGDYPGGHGDVRIHSLVVDQIIGDGMTIRNANPLVKIQIDDGYIHIVDSKQRIKGLWFEKDRVRSQYPRLSLACTLNADSLRAKGHAAVTLDGARQSLLRPQVTGRPGNLKRGDRAAGAGHDRVGIDATMVDPSSVWAGRKVVINGKTVPSTGHYGAAGERA